MRYVSVSNREMIDMKIGSMRFGVAMVFLGPDDARQSFQPLHTPHSTHFAAHPLPKRTAFRRAARL